MSKKFDDPSGYTPNTDEYSSLTEEEKDLALQESLMRLHKLIYQIGYWNDMESAGDEERSDDSSL